MPERTADQSSHTAVLLQRGERFFFYQPDTGLISSDESIETAYAKFESLRGGFLDEAQRAGLTRGQGVVPGLASQTAMPRDFAGELKLFLAKTCIVLVVVAAIGAFAGLMVARSVGGLAAAIDQAVTPLKSIALSDVARKAADVAKDIQSLTKEDRELLRQSLGTISRESESIVDSWRNPPPPAQPAKKP